MTINGGGPNGSNILTTHPKRKKQGRAKRNASKRGFLKNEPKEEVSQKFGRTDRVYLLKDLSESQRNAFLSNLLDAHSHRIEHITSEDIATALKSLPFVIGVPRKTVDEAEQPIVVASLNDRTAKTVITKQDVLQFLQ